MDKQDPLLEEDRMQKKREEINQLGKLERFIIKKTYKTILYTKVFLECMLEWWTIKEFNLAQKNIWLKTNSILWNQLWQKNADWELIYSCATAGLWNAQSINNPLHVGMLNNKDMLSILLEEIKNNDTECETPDEYLNIFEVDHVLQFTKLNITSALEYWAIRHVSYGEAFENMEDDSALEQIRSLKKIDNKIYQITPKWNGLIIPQSQGGDTTPKKDSQEQKDFIGIPWLAGI